MGYYTFHYYPDEGGTEVAVRFNDTERHHITDVLDAFRQFLLGVTFQPQTISKYIDVAAVEEEMTRRAREEAAFARSAE